MKDAQPVIDQEGLSKIYLALWVANHEAAKIRNFRILINTALPAEAIWRALDHETRIATRRRTRWHGPF